MQQVDYVIIGGGSAGSTLAGRLSENPQVTAALLEAGGDGNDFVINTPTAMALMLPTRLHNWAFSSVPQEHLDGRQIYQPRGKGLGGSSIMNAMIYIRGHASDYDHWAALGNTGWSFQDVLPYFLQSENNHDIEDKWHGNTGPLHVSNLRTHNPFHQVFARAAQQAGFPLNNDFNGDKMEGLGTYQVTQHNGERCSAYRAYVMPHIGKRRNLAVKHRVAVQRILFDGKRAIGVEYLQDGQYHTMRARKEVILSAGALQSPQLLMLSGVGDPDELCNAGISVIHALPGVGKNLQDHPDITLCYKAKSNDLFAMSAGGAARYMKAIGEYRRQRTGIITSNFSECGGFLSTREGLPAPDVQLHFVLGLVDNHARTLHHGAGFTCHTGILRPKSRGTLSLLDKDSRIAPLIDPQYLSHPDDMDDMVAAYKLADKLMQAPALAELITKNLYTSDVRTDEDIRALLKARADTIYHPAGTCKMGTDTMAVVDPQLRVHGMHNLRVVDASIMPTLVSGNTNAPTMMIAEKAAAMIAQAH